MELTALCTFKTLADGTITVTADDASPEMEMVLQKTNTMLAAGARMANTLREEMETGADTQDCQAAGKCPHECSNEVYRETIEILKQIALPSAQHKGIMGEQMVERHIREHIKTQPEAYVVNRTKDQKHASDLDVAYKNLRCCVEVKNIDKQLSLSNLVVFRNTYLPSEDYNCGLFVSLRSSYGPSTCVRDFAIVMHDNKPAIYLDHVMESPWKIAVALDVLDFLVAKPQSAPEMFASMVSSLVRANVQSLKAVNTRINSAAKELTEAKKAIKQTIEELTRACQ